MSTDLDICLCDRSRYLAAINSSGMLEMHQLDFADNSKNVFSNGVAVRKKVYEIVNSSKTVMMLECCNRIELPFMSLLVREAASPGFSVFIL